MKLLSKIKDKAMGIIETVNRFPLTIIMLAFAAITYIIMINLEKQGQLGNLFVTLLLGASIATVLQIVYERFFDQKKHRYLLMGVTMILSLFYYLLIRGREWQTEITIRTVVIFFLLFVAFLWIPSIHSRINFNQSFMAAFKAFFTAAFFHGVLFLGIALILGAIDLLITSVHENSYLYSIVIIFVLLAPVHFLSLIPLYRGKQGNTDVEEEAQAKLLRFITPTKFLEALVSYVIIPIASVFTIILLVYILMNITGDFWTDNLLEPMLVIYSIVVIIVYLLASTMDNAFAKYFRMIFPKVLIPVVLFQTISSVLKIQEVGVTYGRYFVILFGVFATLAGILFCVKPIQKNGILAPILIILSILSIMPVTNAFTISRVSQINRLAAVLERNHMLVEDTIVPREDISDKDRKTIVSAVDYLDQMNETKAIKWLAGYSESHNFARAFGFDRYGQVKDDYISLSITRDKSVPVPINGYDFMTRYSIYSHNDQMESYVFSKAGEEYVLQLEYDKDPIIILRKSEEELIQFNLKEIFHKFEDNTGDSIVTIEEVTFTKENERAALSVIADNININSWEGNKNEQADIYILIKIK